MSVNICPIKAYLTRNTEYLSEMDPYVLFVLGNQKKRTETKQEAGKKVSWDQKLTFSPEGDNMLLVQVFDEDRVTDDEVGSGVINLTPYFSIEGPVQCPVSLKYNKKPAGKVILLIQPSCGKFHYSNIAVEKPKKQRISFFSPEDVIQMLRNNELGSTIKAVVKRKNEPNNIKDDYQTKKLNLINSARLSNFNLNSPKMIQSVPHQYQYTPKQAQSQPINSNFYHIPNSQYVNQSKVVQRGQIRAPTFDPKQYMKSGFY